MTDATDMLVRLLQDEMTRPIPAEAAAVRDAILSAHGGSVAAVLFYGSCLRNTTSEGVLDFYVLVDRYRDYHCRRIAAFFNRLVPPTVSFWTVACGHKTVLAKVAVIARDQFARRLEANSLDVTIWARFCQPTALAHARDAEAAAWVGDALARAVLTAVEWSVRLGPKRGTARDFWRALFLNTYGAEIRPERGKDQAGAVFDGAADRYERLFAIALSRADVTLEHDPEGLYTPQPRGPRRRWWPRRILGKFMTVVRLAKASFTVANGADYVVWKIERHSGRRITLSAWQRAHPLLSAPLLLWKLWRSGAVR